jgi:glycosyltransferase involved in cell wall biosynthesis
MSEWDLLHLISSDRWTGAAEPVCNLLLGLRGKGHRVRLGLIRGKSFEFRARERDLELVEGLHLHRGFNPFKDVADLKTLARLVRSERIDLIHCHSNMDHWLAALARRFGRLSVPLVRTQHRVTGVEHEWGVTWLWRRMTDAVVVLGEERRRHDLAAARLHGDQIQVIRGSVDTERFHPSNSGAAAREAMGIPAQAPVVGMIAQFKAGRGWSTAVPAFIRVADEHPETHFILAGGRSSLVREIRDRLAGAGCLDRSHFIHEPHIPNPGDEAPADPDPAWPEILAAMDMSVWLAPGSEGSGRAMLEMMATGRPVIAGDLGVAPEVIEDGVSGTMVPRGVTAETLAKAVSHLIANAEMRRTMGRAARETVEQKFTLERQVDEMQDLYSKLIG